MTIRKMMWFGIVVLCISMTLPMMIAAQAPAQDGQRGERGGGGGQRAAPPPPTNLQVLPKDMTRPQVVQVMQQFTMGLGVMCNYCHAEMVGAPPNANGPVQSEISDFGSEMQDSSNFKISALAAAVAVRLLDAFSRGGLRVSGVVAELDGLLVVLDGAFARTFEVEDPRHKDVGPDSH